MGSSADILSAVPTDYCFENEAESQNVHTRHSGRQGSDHSTTETAQYRILRKKRRKKTDPVGFVFHVNKTPWWLVPKPPPPPFPPRTHTPPSPPPSHSFPRPHLSHFPPISACPVPTPTDQPPNATLTTLRVMSEKNNQHPHEWLVRLEVGNQQKVLVVLQY